MKIIKLSTVLFIIIIIDNSCKISRTNITIVEKTITQNDSSRLSFYNGDTIAYVHYLVKNQSKYVGKPLSFLLNDLDFRINTFSYSPNFRDKFRIYNLTLIANPYNSPGPPDKYGINKNMEIGIGWQSPLPKDSVNAITISNGSPNYYSWSKKAVEYFGKQIVGNLWITYTMKRE